MSVLVADPPWQFGDKLPGNGRGAEKHYRCLSLKDLCSFAIPNVGPDGLLFLWRVAAMQSEAIAVAKAWGFTIKSELVWRKLTANGKRHFGMGRYVRLEHEVCLIGARGRATSLIENHSTRSVFDAPVGVHSAKPDAFYQLVEGLAPSSVKFEIFARKRRAGWVQFGDQLGAL